MTDGNAVKNQIHKHRLKFIHPSLCKKILALNRDGGNKQIKTWSRASTIYPEAIGHVFLVHNGRGFVPIYPKDEMIGHKFGEFAPTRTFRGHSGDKKGAKKGGK